MNYAEIKNCDIANGPGVRVSLFVSGCNNNCPGCFNQEAQDYNYGEWFTGKTMNTIIDMLRPGFIKGLSVLGGEPMDYKNVMTVDMLINAVRKELPEKTIWVYTGYKFEDLMKYSGSETPVAKATLDILNTADVLVDGPFIMDQKNICLRFRGSENQRLIDLPKTMSTGEIVLWKDWQNDPDQTMKGAVQR